MIFSDVEARALLKQPRWGDPPEDWGDKVNHAGARSVSFGTVDADGAKRPGETVELQYFAGRRTATRKLVYTLFLLMHGTLVRVYQLELCSDDLHGHRNPEGHRVKGSHEHIGADCAEVSGAGLWTFHEGLRFFCEQTTLELTGAIQAPDEFTLRP